MNKEHRLEGNVFSYRVTKDNKVFLFWHGKHIRSLKGMPARAFLEEIAGTDSINAQLIMATVTGNFKRGNER
jgi:hypothetical protein